MSAGGYNFFFFYYRTIIFSYFGYSSLSMFISLGFKFFVPIMHFKYCIVFHYELCLIQLQFLAFN